MYKALSILLPVVQQAVRLTSRTTTDVRTSDPYPGARHFALCTPRKHIHTRIDAYISRRQGGWDPQGRTYDIHKAPLFSTSIKIQGASFFLDTASCEACCATKLDCGNTWVGMDARARAQKDGRGGVMALCAAPLQQTQTRLIRTVGVVAPHRQTDDSVAYRNKKEKRSFRQEKTKKNS